MMRTLLTAGLVLALGAVSGCGRTVRPIDAPEERPAALVRTTAVPALDTWGPPVAEELYDLRDDPAERHDLAAALDRVSRHGGISLGRRPGRHWLRDRFRHPYLREALLDGEP